MLHLLPSMLRSSRRTLLLCLQNASPEEQCKFRLDFLRQALNVIVKHPDTKLKKRELASALEEQFQTPTSMLDSLLEETRKWLHSDLGTEQASAPWLPAYAYVYVMTFWHSKCRWTVCPHRQHGYKLFCARNIC